METDIVAKVTEIVVDTLQISSDVAVDLSPDTPLALIGMDSLNCIDIVVRLEETFDIVIEEDLLVMDLLNTIGKLSGIVRQIIDRQLPV